MKFSKEELEQAWYDYKSNEVLNPKNLIPQKIIKLTEKKKKK